MYLQSVDYFPEFHPLLHPSGEVANVTERPTNACWHHPQNLKIEQNHNQHYIDPKNDEM